MQDRTKREQFRSTIKPGHLHYDDGYMRIIMEIMRITMMMMMISFFVCHTLFCPIVCSVLFPQSGTYCSTFLSTHRDRYVYYMYLSILETNIKKARLQWWWWWLKTYDRKWMGDRLLDVEKKDILFVRLSSINLKLITPILYRCFILFIWK